jgi:hypothetical protein
MTSTRKLTLTALALLAPTAGTLAAQATPATASTGHKYLSQITEVPSGPGVTTSGPFGSLEGGGEGDGLTSDSGNVYIADTGYGVLDEFNSSGGLVTQFPSLEGGNSIAVSHATGEVYSAGLHSGVVTVYGPTGKVLGHWARGEDEILGGASNGEGGFFGASVSINNSTSGLAAGDLYVGGLAGVPGVGQESVMELIKPEAGGKGTRLRLLAGPIASPEVFGTVVDEATGDLVVLGGGVYPTERVSFAIDKPTASGEYEHVLTVSGPPGGSFQRISGAATDPATGDIYIVDRFADVVYQFNSSGAYIGEIANTPSGPFEPYEVAVSSTGDVYVSNLGTNAVDVFGPNITVPAVSTDAASSVNGRKATLEGTVDPSGVSVATCKFEYGTSSSYGSVAPCSSLPGSGNSPVEVGANVTGLAPSTTYHYRLAVTDSEGTLFLGLGKTLTTSSPEATLAVPTHELSTSATLNAVVEPHETAVEVCEFEYGLGEAYGTTVPCSPAPGAGASPVAVSANVAGLRIDAVFHYRVLLTVNGGETVSSNGGGELFATTPIVNGSAPATGITSFAATVTGLFLAVELAPTYHFAYGTTTAYGSNTPQPDAKGYPAEQQAVTETLTGLQPDTTYHYALVTSNIGGGEAAGPDETFTTRPLVPPGILTGGALELTQTSASLTGAVNAEGLPTTYRFEYGTGTTYGASWPTVQVNAGTGDTSQGIAVTVPNLQPTTTYHYRLVATNEDGTSDGADETFTTPGYPTSIVQETPVLTTRLGFFNPEPAHPSSNGTSKRKSKGKKEKAKHRKAKHRDKAKRKKG